MGERRPYKANVGGSNPSPPTTIACRNFLFVKINEVSPNIRLMSISLASIQKIGFVDKAIIHCYDQSLYLLSVILDGVEHFVVDEKGAFIKSFNKLDLQAQLSGIEVGKMLLRQQTPYDEMIGLSEEGGDNTLEVKLGGAEYGMRPKGTINVH